MQTRRERDTRVVRRELPARHAIHFPKPLEKLNQRRGFCSRPWRLAAVRTDGMKVQMLCSLRAAAEFGIGGAHLTFGWRLCALHCERAAGRQASKQAGKSSVWLSRRVVAAVGEKRDRWSAQPMPLHTAAKQHQQHQLRSPVCSLRRPYALYPRHPYQYPPPRE